MGRSSEIQTYKGGKGCLGGRPNFALWVVNNLDSGPSARKTYHVGDQVVHALDGLDLDIGTNEYVALMGPSGWASR